MTLFEMGSTVEPVYSDHPESRTRFHQYVVYVPHVFAPVMMLEYVPVYYNYQTYEPYLINRYQVVYVPFFRQVTYTYYVPYYYSYYQTPERLPSCIEIESDTSSNTSSENSLSEVSSDDVDYEDEINCYFDETSIISSSSSDSECDAENSTELEYPEGFSSDVDSDRANEADAEISSLSDYTENDDKCPALDYPRECIDHIASPKDVKVEPDVASISSFADAEKSESVSGLETVETSSLKIIEGGRNESQVSPERSENRMFFDDSGDLESSVSSLSLVDKCPDENTLGHSELPAYKNEKIKRYGNNFSSQIPVWCEEMPVQNPESLHKIDTEVPGLLDELSSSEMENDSDCSSTITLQDVLISEEYWKEKTVEYFNKRGSELYRSALEGDIHPRRSVPEVGTLATIFEDLPYPVNQPYDDGVESSVDEYFDLPALDVKKSESSNIALKPKKKRFRNTRKFFSGLFRCVRPKTDVQDGQPP